MSASYQRLLEVLKRWPVDKTKGNRDYGLHLRNLAKTAFPAGEVFSGSEVEKIEKCNALLRLADNKYKKAYGSSRSLGATGLTPEQLKTALSQEVVDKFFSQRVKDES